LYSGATQHLAQPDGTGWGSVGLAEAVSHDGEVGAHRVDQRGGDLVAALELAQEQPGAMGTPPARPDGTEERRDGQSRIVRHRSRPPGIRSRRPGSSRGGRRQISGHGHTGGILKWAN
jgi:hypothetical protein